ncbi:MAG: hypothetical protein K0R09_984 [Clostridiales bacterium]|nr:hypothetical protein [Clostridiales bacterium]
MSLETGRVIEIFYMDDKIQILNIENENKPLIEKAINYILETGLCIVGDLVVINTIGNRLGLGTGGYNFIYFNMSNKSNGEQILDRNQGHIIKMKYTPGQLRVKAIEENIEYKKLFSKETKLLPKPVIYTILHSMISPLVKSIKYIKPDAIISCVYTYGGAMNANNSFTLKKLRASGLINSVITTGECYGGDYESINIATGILFGFNQLNSDIIIVCCGPGVAGSSTYYGYSTFDFIGPIYITKLLGLCPVLIPRISMADNRERHMGVSMQSISILQNLDFSVHVPVYRDIEDVEGFRNIYNQLIMHGIIHKHKVQFIEDVIIKKSIDYISADTRVMGRSYIEDPWFFYNCSCAGVYSVGLLNKI